jgi:hypothetical protein
MDRSGNRHGRQKCLGVEAVRHFVEDRWIDERRQLNNE